MVPHGMGHRQQIGQLGVCLDVVNLGKQFIYDIIYPGFLLAKYEIPTS